MSSLDIHLEFPLKDGPGVPWSRIGTISTPLGDRSTQPRKALKLIAITYFTLHGA